MALVLSIFAIIISGLSWWEAHHNRLIVEEVNRPVLACDRVSIGTSWIPGVDGVSGSDDVVIRYGLLIKNMGKETAVLEPYEMREAIVAGIVNESEDCQVLQVLDGSMRGGLEIVPGTEVVIPSALRVSRSCEKRSELKLSFVLVLNYAGKISGSLFRQAIGGSGCISSVSPTEERKKKPAPDLPEKYETVKLPEKWQPYPER